jgi:transposase
MKNDADKEERKRQKEFLKEYYPDYNPIRHDAYVMRYQGEQEKKAIKNYMVNRGIIENE